MYLVGVWKRVTETKERMKIDGSKVLWMEWWEGKGVKEDGWSKANIRFECFSPITHLSHIYMFCSLLLQCSCVPCKAPLYPAVWFRNYSRAPRSVILQFSFPVGYIFLKKSVSMDQWRVFVRNHSKIISRFTADFLQCLLVLTRLILWRPATRKLLWLANNRH